MGSRALPLALATAAFAAALVGLGGLALWLGLCAVPAAAAAAFVAVSDVLEGQPKLLRALTNSFALAFIVLECAVRSNAVAGAGAPPLATWALLAALFVYAAPAVAWVLEPVKVGQRPRAASPRRRAAVVDGEIDDVLSRAA